MGISKVLSAGVLTAALGVVALPAAIYASTYDPATNTITADGSALSSSDRDALVADNDGSITLKGSIQQIRDSLVLLQSYLSADTALVDKLAAIDSSVTLNIVGDAEVIPNDLGYIKYLLGAVGNSNNPAVAVNVDGNVTFGAGTDDYVGDTIANVATNQFTIKTAGTITLPGGSDINTFFGAATVATGIVVSVDGQKYVSTGSGTFEAVPAPVSSAPAAITSPDTGIQNSLFGVVLMAAALVATISAGAIGLVLGKKS